ncbi:SIMPL domain-containing protein [Aquamicrobium segne]|uniref:SIMPL domain-containing protein n=1 Tax=Aquamicrobium segne TaxID=469547 RepID=A0ABW0H179_9HYPH
MNGFILPLTLAAAIALPAIAQAKEPGQTPRIFVTGEGETSIAPDMAILSLSVTREAKTAREALDANNDAMAAVITAMKAASIEDRDLQTAGIQISPRYNYETRADGTQKAELVAYQVTNTLSVRIREIDKAGELLDKAVTLGVNEGGGIVFTNSDPQTALTEARKKAVANALSKARTLAEAAGASVGKVLEISEQSGTPQPIRMAARSFDAMPQAAAVPVQAGENSYRVQVNVTFELK